MPDFTQQPVTNICLLWYCISVQCFLFSSLLFGLSLSFLSTSCLGCHSLFSRLPVWPVLLFSTDFLFGLSLSSFLLTSVWAVTLFFLDFLFGLSFSFQPTFCLRCQSLISWLPVWTILLFSADFLFGLSLSFLLTSCLCSPSLFSWLPVSTVLFFSTDFLFGLPFSFQLTSCLGCHSRSLWLHVWTVLLCSPDLFSLDLLFWLPSIFSWLTAQTVLLFSSDFLFGLSSFLLTSHFE